MREQVVETDLLVENRGRAFLWGGVRGVVFFSDLSIYFYFDRTKGLKQQQKEQ